MWNCNKISKQSSICQDQSTATYLRGSFGHTKNMDCHTEDIKNVVVFTTSACRLSPTCNRSLHMHISSLLPIWLPAFPPHSTPYPYLLRLHFFTLTSSPETYPACCPCVYVHCSAVSERLLLCLPLTRLPQQPCKYTTKTTHQVQHHTSTIMFDCQKAVSSMWGVRHSQTLMCPRMCVCMLKPQT